eukprot:12670163-Alexandrium_andersonii.AAC.1
MPVTVLLAAPGLSDGGAWSVLGSTTTCSSVSGTGASASEGRDDILQKLTCLATLGLGALRELRQAAQEVCQE